MLGVQIVAPDEKFDVKICVEEAAVIVSASKEPKTVCTVTFTSPVMRDENTGATEGGNDGNVASTNTLCLSLSRHTQSLSEEHNESVTRC